MNKRVPLLVILCVLAALVAFFAFNQPQQSAAPDRADEDIAWQYKTAAETKEMIDRGDEAIYLDIRYKDKYEAGHLPGALGIHVFPVDTPELENALRAEKARLASDAPIIVVCESGNKGAKRTISVLIEEGFPAGRLFILEGGAKGWPFAEMLVTGNGGDSRDNAETEVSVEKTKVYVGAEWLSGVIAGKQPQSANYVILEASWGKPGNEYKTSHIPGAVHINTDLIEEDKYWNIRAPQEIEQVMKDFGITKDTAVIVYGNDSAAARVAFVCLWAGVEEVHLLDGGYKTWLAAGYPTASGVEKPKPVESFGAAVPAHPEYVLSLPLQTGDPRETSR